MILKYEKQYQKIDLPIATDIGNPLTTEELITRLNPHFASNLFEKYFDFQGGLFSSDEPLSAWKKSVKEDPAIIDGIYYCCFMPWLKF